MSHLPKNQGTQRLGPIHVDPAQLARHRIEVSRGRAITGEDISGITISGRCRVVLVNGEAFDAYDFGSSGGVRRIVRASDGLVFAFTSGWIRSISYYFERRPAFRGHHLAHAKRIGGST